MRHLLCTSDSRAAGGRAAALLLCAATTPSTGAGVMADTTHFTEHPDSMLCWRGPRTNQEGQWQTIGCGCEVHWALQAGGLTPSGRHPQWTHNALLIRRALLAA